MIKNSPNDIVDLVKIANYLDQVGEIGHSDELTKVAQNLLYEISNPNTFDTEEIMEEIIAGLED